ncbi:MAG: hypothetical protein IPP12_22580 [Nitrospira sp.]|nr:hypothetical protein [Nitrospira sp.]
MAGGMLLSANAAVTSVLVSCAQVPPAVVPSLWKIRRTPLGNANEPPFTASETKAGAAQVATPPLVVRMCPFVPGFKTLLAIAPAANEAVTSASLSCVQVPPAVVPSLWKIRLVPAGNAAAVPATVEVAGGVTVDDAPSKNLPDSPETEIVPGPGVAVEVGDQ